MARVNPFIFRTYDIRGKALTELTEEACLLIGKAFGSTVRELYGKEHPTLAVGRDMRTHSPQLKSALVAGLVSTGCTVLKIGETPTPTNYFTICDRQLDGGLQITASHNPKEDNGIKLQIRDAAAFAGEDIQRLRERIERGDFLTGKGSEETIDAVGPYLHFLQKEFGRCGEGLTVAIDTGNGATGPVCLRAFESAGAKVIGLYLDPDGTFPNHPADPSKTATLRELRETVVEREAHIGFGFDGDGDRVGLVDERGQIRTADETLLLLAREYLRKFPGAAIVFTTSMSSTLETEIRKWDGKPVMCAVGHSIVEHEMKRTGAPLGGEQSGHFFLADRAHGYDDALIVALELLTILREAQQPCSALFADFPKVYHAEELRLGCPDSEKTRIVRAITAHFRKEYPVDTTDGARIDFSDGAWANIRQSNTSPLLSVCMEARSEEKLATMQKIIVAHLKTHPEITWK
ncbi:MAG: phosphomannomutase/phosphoglucomutase [Candidatus Peribacteraceae bacterium]|nr:phosphomannomutase/phosphoglucomutase [Candidatus Peribacteraceae bacterium]